MQHQTQRHHNGYDETGGHKNRLKIRLSKHGQHDISGRTIRTRYTDSTGTYVSIFEIFASIIYLRFKYLIGYSLWLL